MWFTTNQELIALLIGLSIIPLSVIMAVRFRANGSLITTFCTSVIALLGIFMTITLVEILRYLIGYGFFEFNSYFDLFLLAWLSTCIFGVFNGLGVSVYFYDKLKASIEGE